jgi:CDP-diacylglycerol---glycerol-3-phosphate 3-phosphatidyltransferase
MAKILSGARAGLGRVLDPTARALLRAGISPDAVTIAGTLGVLVAAGFAARGEIFIATMIATVSCLSDLIDGAMARQRGTASRFGAFLDSTMDRYSDMVLYLGLLLLYARLDKTPDMVLVWVAAFGGFMTSYARARAESLIPRCTVGLLERPERIVLIVIGALANRMTAVLWIIAVLSNVTALQRIVYTYVELKRGWTRPRAGEVP